MFIASLAAILAMTSDLVASPSGDIQAPPGPIPPSLFDLNILFHPIPMYPGRLFLFTAGGFPMLIGLPLSRAKTTTILISSINT